MVGQEIREVIWNLAGGFEERIWRVHEGVKTEWNIDFQVEWATDKVERDFEADWLWAFVWEQAEWYALACVYEGLKGNGCPLWMNL